MNIRSFVIILLILFNATSSKGIIPTQSLNVENGLSQTTVYAIYQDEFGRLWLGTRDGLNCFDGNKISYFKPIPHDSTSLFGNNIEELTGNKKGGIYIRCKYGLVHFDLKTQKFNTISYSSIYCISYGTELWVCTKNEIYYYDEKIQKLILYCRLGNESIQISYIKELSNSILYVGTKDDGLYAIDKNKQPKLLIGQIGVHQIYEDSKRNTWVCTRQNGLYKITDERNITNYTKQPIHSKSISSNVVRSIVEDNMGNFWIGTLSGLNKFNPNNQEFTLIASPDNPFSVVNNSVLYLLKDVQGSIWAGMYYGGVRYFNPEFDIYNYYKSVENEGNHLSSPTVGKMIEDQTGNIWICTEGGGLNYLNRLDDKITVYRNNPNKNSISSDVVKSVLIDDTNPDIVWVGTIFRGLNMFDLAKKQFTHIKNENLPSSDKESYSVRKIIQWGDTLFVATHTGLKIYTKSTNVFSELSVNQKTIGSNLQIIDMCLDKTNSTLWCSNSAGIFTVNLKNKNVESFPNSNVIYANTYNKASCIFLDSTNKIWIGTSGDGLIYFDTKNRKFVPFKTGNTILDQAYVLAIAESKMGYLLVGTNDGFFKIDVENKSFELFDYNSGFPISVINDYGILVAKDGQIFVGGISGMISFNENSLNYPPKDYQINIVAIEINNVPISKDKQSPLYMDKIELKPSDKVISIEFVTSNYIKAVHTNIEYRLVGFENSWIKAGSRRLITYTNLEPGDYILEIRSVDASGGMNMLKKLEIVVATPFYRSIPAILLYMVLIGIIGLMLLRFYTSRIKLSSSLEMEKREKEQLEKLNQAKQNFFINISHEFRTPLTLIIGHIESLLQSTTLSPSAHKKIQLIANNAQRTNKLITELLDFNKLENGRYKFKISKQNIIPLLNEIYLNFKEYSRYQQIDYQFIYSEEEIELYVDTTQIEKVFYNLLSNAFNYTRAGDSIKLRISSSDNTVFISVEDTGIGIKEEFIDKIFDRYYQIGGQSKTRSKVKGSGIGLFYAKSIVEGHGGSIEVNSNIVVGTSFTVTIPKGYEHFEDVSLVEWGEKDSALAKTIEMPDSVFFNKIENISANQSKAKLLIVEDNDEMKDLLIDIFNPLYNIKLASDGEEGLAIAENYQPDIIVSDVMMPKLTGIEMCEKLKSNTNTSHIPIVLLTAKAAIDFKIEGLQTGADDYIIKPFNAKELVVRCNNILTNRYNLQLKFSEQIDYAPQLVTNNDLDQRFLEKLITMVEENISNSEFSIDNISRDIGMGRTNLFAKIKSLTGMTPNEFILNARLKKSMELVLRSNLNTSEIAYETGFSSSSYFIKCFKQLYGKTPSDFRKQ